MILQTHYITDELLFNSVTIQLADMSTEAFLSPLYHHFQQAVALILNSPRENIVIFSVQVHPPSILNISPEKKNQFNFFFNIFPLFSKMSMYLFIAFFHPFGNANYIFSFHLFFL